MAKLLYDQYFLENELKPEEWAILSLKESQEKLELKISEESKALDGVLESLESTLNEVISKRKPKLSLNLVVSSIFENIFERNLKKLQNYSTLQEKLDRLKALKQQREALIHHLGDQIEQQVRKGEDIERNNKSILEKEVQLKQLKRNIVKVHESLETLPSLRRKVYFSQEDVKKSNQMDFLRAENLIKS